LHEAARQGKVALARDLVARGADLEAITDRPPGRANFFRSYGLTPFLTAVESGSVEMMRALVALGANAKAKNADGVGAMLLAAGSRKLDAVKLAFELGADVNESRSRGGTAIHTAIRFGSNEIIEFLAAHGADLFIKDAFGRTALEEAEFEAPKPTIELVRRLTEEARRRRTASETNP
jgi:uncharacterized protein